MQPEQSDGKDPLLDGWRKWQNLLKLAKSIQFLIIFWKIARISCDFDGLEEQNNEIDAILMILKFPGLFSMLGGGSKENSEDEPEAPPPAATTPRQVGWSKLTISFIIFTKYRHPNSKCSSANRFLGEKQIINYVNFKL